MIVREAKVRNAEAMDVVDSLLTSHESGALYNPEKQGLVLELLVSMAKAVKEQNKGKVMP